MRFILGSSSKNRQALLERMGFEFEMIPPDYEEIPSEGESTVAMVERFALGKAQSVYEKLKSPPRSPSFNKEGEVAPSFLERRGLGEDLDDFMILGCDSMISLEGQSIGKAASAQEALEQMMFFRGKPQEVITGLALVGQYQGQPFQVVESEVTPLKFREDFDEALVEKYLAFGDWEGKCGSYSILGTGIFFLEDIQGDFQNVIGLPVIRLGSMIQKAIGKHPLEILNRKANS